MEAIQPLFKFVCDLLSEKIVDDVIQKNREIFLRPDEEFSELIAAYSYEDLRNGNFVKVKITEDQVSIDHFYIKDGTVKHLEEERADNGNQPNMLSIFDEKKKKKIDSYLLRLDSKEGEREREAFLDRVVHYIDRLQEYLNKDSRFAKNGAV